MKLSWTDLILPSQVVICEDEMKWARYVQFDWLCVCMCVSGFCANVPLVIGMPIDQMGNTLPKCDLSVFLASEPKIVSISPAKGLTYTRFRVIVYSSPGVKPTYPTATQVNSTGIAIGLTSKTGKTMSRTNKTPRITNVMPLIKNFCMKAVTN